MKSLSLSLNPLNVQDLLKESMHVNSKSRDILKEMREIEIIMRRRRISRRTMRNMSRNTTNGLSSILWRGRGKGRTLWISTWRKVWELKRNTNLFWYGNIEKQGITLPSDQRRIMKIGERRGNRTKKWCSYKSCKQDL